MFRCRSGYAIVLREHKTARKMGKPRRIPIVRKLRELLDQAIRNRSEGPIFLSAAGAGWRVENLGRPYSRLRDAAGLPRDLVLYLARHECGTKICQAKGIEYARRLPGHSNISTTQRYVHLDDRELAEAQDLVELAAFHNTSGQAGGQKRSSVVWTGRIRSGSCNS